MYVTLSGIIIFVKFLQLSKALSPIYVTPSGMTISSIAVPLKHQPGMLVICEGIFTFLRFAQFWNA